MSAALSRLPEAYAVSVWIEEDHPDGPLLQLSYNTLAQVEEAVAAGHDRSECLWNYALWLQEDVQLIGHDTPLRDEWLRESGTYCPPEATETADEAEFERLMELKERTFAGLFRLVAEVVRRLHAEGRVRVPVLVHDLDYSERAREATQVANPPELIRDLMVWWA